MSTSELQGSVIALESDCLKSFLGLSAVSFRLDGSARTCLATIWLWLLLLMQGAILVLALLCLCVSCIPQSVDGLMG